MPAGATTIIFANPKSFQIHDLETEWKDPDYEPRWRFLLSGCWHVRPLAKTYSAVCVSLYLDDKPEFRKWLREFSTSPAPEITARFEKVSVLPGDNGELPTAEIQFVTSPWSKRL